MNPFMIQALLKILNALGVQFDAAALAQWIATAQEQLPRFVIHVQARINDFDVRLKAMEQEQRLLREINETQCALLEQMAIALDLKETENARRTDTAIARTN